MNMEICTLKCVLPTIVADVTGHGEMHYGMLRWPKYTQDRSNGYLIKRSKYMFRKPEAYLAACELRIGTILVWQLITFVQECKQGRRSTHSKKHHLF